MSFLKHEEPKQNNATNILLGVIIVLLIVIAVWAFYMGQIIAKKELQTSPNNAVVNNTNQVQNTNQASVLEVTVIDDKRCTNCTTNEILESLKKVPGLQSANFVTKDYIEDNMKEYTSANGIKNLPAFIFPTNFVDPGVNQFLEAMPNGSYALNIGASANFDPEAKRSERGYTVVSEQNLETLKNETNYIKGNQDAKILWFEYTNFACPACVQFHKSGIHKEVLDKFGENVAYASKHFHFFEKAYPAAEFIECAAEQLGSDGYYSIEKNIFIDGVLDVETLTQKALELGANKSQLETCLASDKHLATTESVKNNGAAIFNVTGTPANFLINMETGEYMKINDFDADIRTFIWE